MGSIHCANNPLQDRSRNNEVNSRNVWQQEAIKAHNQRVAETAVNTRRRRKSGSDVHSGSYGRKYNNAPNLLKNSLQSPPRIQSRSLACCFLCEDIWKTVLLKDGCAGTIVFQLRVSNSLLFHLLLSSVWLF